MRIDLNADLGESYGRWRLGDDLAMLAVVTSANIACGFHAGDPTTLRATCEQAVGHGVVIGAQVGYRDLAGFGRRYIDVAPRDLQADVIYQIGALDGLARVAGSRVRYVKPHGALYNAIVHDRVQAAAVVEAVRAYDQTLPILGLPGSAVLDLARSAGLATVAEAFADRAYTPRATLVDRRHAGALLSDPEQVARRVLRLVSEHRVEAADGSLIGVEVRSVCLHGDSPGAVEMAAAVRDTLRDNGCELRSFVDQAASD